jgi:tetratricopeptide (TPR) repeat protein
MASEVAVPLQAIAIATNCDGATTAKVLHDLIDQSLVVIFGDCYALSPPIQEAVERARGVLGPEDYNRIARGLTTTFWSDETVAPSLYVVDATLHAVARSSNTSLQLYADLVRPSTIHRLAAECYRSKQWLLAMEYSRRVQQMDPRRRDAWAIEFKSLIQLERWDDAEIVLQEIENSRDRIAFYLKGFGLRKRQFHREACGAFEQALRTGDKASSVYRDYADSLYRLGEYERAAEMVKVVLDRDPENIFILDLMARVHLDVGDLAAAEETIRQLERYDISNRFIFHRRATLYVRRGLWDLALLDADEACKLGASPFESFAQRANILIELDRLSEAREALSTLELRFTSHGRDVRRGLTCKLLTREGHWREARSVWDQLDDKRRPVHRHLLLQLLLVLESDPTATLVERQRARQTIHQLEAELATAKVLDPVLPLG